MTTNTTHFVRIRRNTYFKGGKDDNFISGLWIGNEIQENVLFIGCQFNGVQATFKNCVFIDCDGVNERMIAEGGKAIFLLDNIRLTAEYRDANGEWR